MDSQSEEKNTTGIVVGHHHHHQSHLPSPSPPPPFYGTSQGSEDNNTTGTVVGHHHHKPYPSPPQPLPPYYGTFQGIPNFSPSIGIPQPGQAPYYGYQSVPGYGCAVDEEGQFIREQRPLCCGFGLGWCLFLLGFFFGGIPWYAGALLLICSRRSLDHREKPGYILCTIAAVLVTVALVLGMSQGDDYDW